VLNDADERIPEPSDYNHAAGGGESSHGIVVRWLLAMHAINQGVDLVTQTLVEMLNKGSPVCLSERIGWGLGTLRRWQITLKMGEGKPIIRELLHGRDVEEGWNSIPGGGMVLRLLMGLIVDCDEWSFLV
jgi:hypothetical protein